MASSLISGDPLVEALTRAEKSPSASARDALVSRRIGVVSRSATIDRHDHRHQQREHRDRDQDREEGPQRLGAERVGRGERDDHGPHGRRARELRPVEVRDREGAGHAPCLPREPTAGGSRQRRLQRRDRGPGGAGRRVDRDGQVRLRNHLGLDGQKSRCFRDLALKSQSTGCRDLQLVKLVNDHLGAS